MSFVSVSGRPLDLYDRQPSITLPNLRAEIEAKARKFINAQYAEADQTIRQALIDAGWTPPSDMGIPISPEAENPISPEAENPVSTHKLNGDQTVAVATDVFFNEDMTTCPRGAKVQLLGAGGVAAYGSYTGDSFWVGWAPVPKRRAKP